MISPLLKPAPRGPKPKRPIARGKRPARVRQTKRGREKESLNRLWSRVVMAKGSECFLRCSALCDRRAVDPAHLWPKSVYPSIRHLPDVGFPACRVCHMAFDGGDAMLRAAVRIRLIGARRLVEISRLAQLPSPDRAEARAALTAQLRRIAA